MNALKNVLFFGLLIAVLCGVYLSLSRQPEVALPPDLQTQVKPLNVEVPGLNGSPAASIPGNPAAENSTATSPPTGLAASGSGGLAPPYQPPTPPATTTAPPFPPPGQVGALPPPPSDTPPPAVPDTRYARNYPPGVTDPSTSGRVAEGRNVEDNRYNPLAAPPHETPPKPAFPPPVTTQVSLPAPPTEEHTHVTSIDTILQQVELKMRENKLADALLILSPLHDNPDVPEYQAQKITEILDYMAAKVIYSREPTLEGIYRVQSGDTLDKIADRYQVPGLLLARINGIDVTKDLPTGKELKVLKGPFSAHVHTARSEVKMMLGGRYAGRFPMVLSNDLQNAAGIYHVLAKSTTGADGNPTKPQWIELDNASGKIGIQGAADPRIAAASGKSPSTIWLNERDMDDVYGILSVGSVVIIQR